LFPVEVNGVPIRWHVKPAALNVLVDITERKKSEEQIRYLAHHDRLTGLPNRRLLMDRLNQSLEIARRQNSRLEILFVDLNRFKPVNDTYDHEVGDTLLKAVGDRLEETLRVADTVARVGGSVGVASYPDDGTTPDELLRLADSHM